VKLCPQVERLTPAALTWVRVASAVKSIDDVAVFRAARSDALLVWRHYLASQDPSQPEATVDQVVAALGGFRAPGRLVLELWNECHPTAEQLRRVVAHAHALGFLVAVGSWGTGDYTQSDWDAAVASGADYIAVHAYWSPEVGPTVWNAYRWRQFWRPGQPKVLVTECGFDRVRDGDGGTYVGQPGYIADGLSAEQLLTSLVAYGAAIKADPAVAYAFPFTCGPTPDWAAFDVDPIAARLAALATPAPQPNPNHGGHPMPQIGAGLLKAAPLIGPLVDDETYDAPGTDHEVSKVATAKGYANWSKATNETVVYCNDGRLFADGGNHGTGSLQEIRGPFLA
jgi:hypothetical protein